ncbi:MAG: hypothetical protein N4A33_04880 [Bacteriovoracaceae bacterium]|jgi:hypothetical protein|nr:hypothetical protein [Bacteriovoracaceae bacterium]
MKLLILLFIFSSSLIANGPKQILVSKVKQKEIENKLSNNKEIAKCKESEDPSLCIKQLVDNMDTKALEAITEDLKSDSSYDIEAGKDSAAIRAFMQKRIENIMQGDKANSKKQRSAKDIKLVDHNRYRDIYKSQLGKNMLLDINNYCLETLGSHLGKTYSLSHYEQVDGSHIIKFDNGIAGPKDVSFDKLDEYYESNKRDLDQIKKIKDFQVKRALKEKATTTTMCGALIPMFCKYYQCTQTPENKRSDLEKSTCRKLSASYKMSNTKGKVACSLTTRLEAYKKTLGAIKEQNKLLEDNRISSVGLEVDKAYRFNKTSQKNIDNLTTLASRDLVNSVDKIASSKQEAEQLKDKCDDNPNDLDCISLEEDLSDDDVKDIEFENNAAIAIYQAKLEKLSENKDEFKKYLENNNLDQKYGQKLEDLGPAQLAKIIGNDYATKKRALIDSMMDKYNQMGLKKKVTGTEVTFEDSKDTKVDKLKSEKIKSIEDKKEYIATMYEYSNMISSFLELSVEKGSGDNKTREVVGTFSQLGSKEIEALKNSKDEQDQILYQEYQGLFNDNNQTSAGQNQDKGYLDFLDTILGE